MQGILIDPRTRTIVFTDEYDGDFKTIQRIIHADAFDCVRIDDSETIYVDDEGLINGNGAKNGFFYVLGDNPFCLAGRGLILATDNEGDSIATKLTLEDVERIVRFGQIIRHANGNLEFVATDGTAYPIP